MNTLKINTQVEIDFVVEMLIISPLEKIVMSLENQEYRDCDVSWLNERLEYFTSMALELMNVKLRLPKGLDGIMNKLNTEKFLGYFKTILDFFRRYV